MDLKNIKYMGTLDDALKVAKNLSPLLETGIFCPDFKLGVNIQKDTIGIYPLKGYEMTELETPEGAKNEKSFHNTGNSLIKIFTFKEQKYSIYNLEWERLKNP